MRASQYFRVASDLATSAGGRDYLANLLAAAERGEIYMRRIHLALIRLALRRA